MPAESAVAEAQTDAVAWLRLLRDESPYEVFLGSDGLPVVQGDAPHMTVAAQVRRNKPAAAPPIVDGGTPADLVNQLETGQASMPVAERWSHMEGDTVKPGTITDPYQKVAHAQPQNPVAAAADMVQGMLGNMLGNHRPGDSATESGAAPQPKQVIQGDPGTGYVQGGGLAEHYVKPPTPPQRDWNAPEDGVDVHEFASYVFIGKDRSGLTIYAGPDRYKAVEMLDAARLEFNKQ